MSTFWKGVFSVVRTSEFWVFLAQVIIMGISTPVPDEFKVVGWLYITFRIVGKVVAFIFPNPDSTAPKAFSNDTK